MALPSVQKSFDSFALRGGLDLHTPHLSLKPGVARSALNFECSITGGYTRIPGYERYDGGPLATDANVLLFVPELPGIWTPVVGEILTAQGTGPAIGQSATVRYAGPLTPSTKPLYIALAVAGTMPALFDLKRGSTTVGSGRYSDTGSYGVNSPTDADLSLAQAIGVSVARDQTAAVPGAGPVLGVFHFDGSLYAWRNNTGGTAAVLHRASSSGWQAVPGAIQLRFTAGSVAPTPGGTITKAGAAATVRRVIVESGTWASGTAAGRVILAAAPATSFTAGAITTGMTATLSGAEAAATWLPDGRFEHVVADAGNGILVYGCDGINRAFEFDGTSIVPIVTTNTVDVPTHLAVHQRYLFLSFLVPAQAGFGKRASVQHSGVADPYKWEVISGAAEIVVDDPVTGFLRLPGSETSPAMAILSSAAASILYGTSPSTWQRVPTSWAVGAKAFTPRPMSHGMVFTDMGVMAIESVQNYGNFRDASLTVNLRSWVRERRTTATEALVNREKSQYRVYFADGSGLYVTMTGGKFSGAMPVQFPHPVRVACSGSTSNGVEVSYFGSSDGRVYQLDTGTSFAGEPIEFTCELAFASQGNARVKKRYRRASFEIDGTATSVTMNVGYLLGYGSDQVVQSASVDKVVSSPATSSAWDSATWDTATWDGRTLGPAQVPLEGTERNIALILTGSSATTAEFTINSITLHYTPRGELRD